MTYVIVVVTIALVVLFFLARWLLDKPVRYTRLVGDDLTKAFTPLLDETYPAAFLIIEAGNKEKFIQFRRYATQSGKGIQFGFPRAPWSEMYYPALRKLLDDQGIDYAVEATGQDTVVSFITVDFERDPVKASRFASGVLRDVFGLEANSRIKTYLRH